MRPCRVFRGSPVTSGTLLIGLRSTRSRISWSRSSTAISGVCFSGKTSNPVLPDSVIRPPKPWLTLREQCTRQYPRLPARMVRDDLAVEVRILCLRRRICLWRCNPTVSGSRDLSFRRDLLPRDMGFHSHPHRQWRDEMSNEKLSGGDKHFLRLIARDASNEGWAKVSAQVMPLVEKMPPALVEIDKDGMRIRLSQEGKDVVNAMAWLG